MSKPEFEVVWKRIVDHAGQKFQLKWGKPFTYKVNGNCVIPSSTNRNIPKNDFKSAYPKVPFAGPGIINRTQQGPAFIWGILHDPRIVGTLIPHALRPVCRRPTCDITRNKFALKSNCDGENAAISKYGKIALIAVAAARGGVHPRKAWEDVEEKLLPGSSESQNKCCPRCAFLGLIDADMIKGISPGNYTTSKANKRYAVEAVNLLKKDSSFCDKPREMWRLVAGENKKHNQQMYVVVALWENGDISTR